MSGARGLFSGLQNYFPNSRMAPINKPHECIIEIICPAGFSSIVLTSVSPVFVACLKMSSLFIPEPVDILN